MFINTLTVVVMVVEEVIKMKIIAIKIMITMMTIIILNVLFLQTAHSFYKEMHLSINLGKPMIKKLLKTK